MQMLLLLH
jgi:hypothetical protein